MGLFATKDCPKGTVLTCYPGDALIDDGKDESDVLWGKHTQHLTNTTDATTLRVDYQDYMLRAVRDDWGIVAIPQIDPDYQDTAYLGNLANDGAKLLPAREQDLAPYVLQSEAKANAQHTCLQDCQRWTQIGRRPPQDGRRHSPGGRRGASRPRLLGKLKP